MCDIQMNILFWNLKKNSNAQWIKHIIIENNVDIAVFAEYENTDFEEVIRNLKNQFIRHDGKGGCNKITLLCSSNYHVTVKREQSRYTLYSVYSEVFSINLVGVHLPSNPYGDANRRRVVIRDLVNDINELENENNHRRTIVIGDMNCNPFDEEMIQIDSFNAVLFKQLILQKELVDFENKRYRRFFNPIIHYLNEDTQSYGTYYYSSGSALIYWNCFDQVLVRKELCDVIRRVDIIREINGKKLIKRIKPNDEISDHLPLLLNIDLRM